MASRLSVCRVCGDYVDEPTCSRCIDALIEDKKDALRDILRDVWKRRGSIHSGTGYYVSLDSELCAQIRDALDVVEDCPHGEDPALCNECRGVTE